MSDYRKKCSAEECEHSFKPHRWSPETQKGSGWFHQRSGESWCPAHVPDWVDGWRKSKQ